LRYFKYEHGAAELHLYPFVCWHLGSPQSDQAFIDSMIKRVAKDPLARWVYMGDGGENAIMGSKGDVYSQTMSPQQQINKLVELLMPIRDKGLFLIKGNHGNRTYKETGMSPDENLSLALQLPYLGTSALARIQVNRSKYDVYFHHGGDSGVAISSKVNAAKKPEAFIVADAIITAHSHALMDLPPRYMVQIDGNRTEPFKWTTTHEYIVGSAYDSRGGYAEEKLYPPIIPSHMMLSFSGRSARREGYNGSFPVKQITSTVFRADANSNPMATKGEQ
jgi:hypothetical protein